MTHKKTRLGVIAALAVAAFTPSISSAQFLDLSRYSFSARYAQGPAEGSAITYDWDTNSLWIAEDEGRSLTNFNMDGTYRGSIALRGFQDVEALSYAGNGAFFVGDERRMTISYAKPLYQTIDKATASTYKFGDQSPNEGIEGFSYDPISGEMFAVKEIRPQGVYQADIDFSQTTATGTHWDLFDPALLGVQTISDIQVLSYFQGTSYASNFLILSATTNMLLEVTRSGQILSSMSLAPYNDKIEGVTIDHEGNIWLVAESGGDPTYGQFFKFAAPIPEPGTYAMFAAGLGVVGAVVRRRKQKDDAAQA